MGTKRDLESVVRSNVKARLKSAGLSPTLEVRTELGRHLGCGHQMVGVLLRGKRKITLRYVDGFASFFGCESSELLEK